METGGSLLQPHQQRAVRCGDTTRRQLGAQHTRQAQPEDEEGVPPRTFAISNFKREYAKKDVQWEGKRLVVDGTASQALDGRFRKPRGKAS